MSWTKKALLGLAALGIVSALVLLGLYIAADGDYSLPPAVGQDSSLPSVTLDGVTLHAQVFGEPTSPVVIVLHGGPGNDFRYLLNLKALAKDYQVVFYDQRGTGRSPQVPAEELTLENMLADVKRVVQHYGKGKPVRLVGHSWGAMLAAGFTAKNPDLVSHLVLAEPGMLTTAAAKDFMAKFKVSFGWTAVKKLAWLWLQSRHVKQVDGQEADDYFFTHLGTLDVDGGPTAGYFCNGRPPLGTTQAWRYSFLSSKRIQGEATSDLDHHPIDLVSGMERFRGSTLFLVGACNTMIGEEFQRKHHMKFFPRATLRRIEGVGHMMFGAKPTESLAVVGRFLAAQ